MIPMSPSIECPECHQVLYTHVTDVLAHAMSHWPVKPSDVNSLNSVEAQRRYLVLARFAQKYQQPVLPNVRDVDDGSETPATGGE